MADHPFATGAEYVGIRNASSRPAARARNISSLWKLVAAVFSNRWNSSRTEISNRWKKSLAAGDARRA
jgi:hypothetical protein